MQADHEPVLTFWLDEVGPKGWYAEDPALDARVRENFLELWEAGRHGRLDAWMAKPRSCLALLILLDQFPRNMYRGTSRAFASDAKALGIAKAAVSRGVDRQVEGDARQFFYLPLMHSETLADQERAVRLFVMHMEDSGNLKHAQAHRAIIRRFGRFPFRNHALGRTTTGVETAWLGQGGYGAEMRALG